MLSPNGRPAETRGAAFAGTALLAVAVLVAGPTSSGHAQGEKKDGKTILEAASSDVGFSKLAAAVKAAGLAEALGGDGPLTVFAPTDRAFEALGEETLKAALADRERLKAILAYHVVAGEVSASEAAVLAKFGKTLKTVNGAELKLSLKGGKLALPGDTAVVKADLKAKNGVIHLIDKVLLPPAGKVAARKRKRKELCIPAAESALFNRVIRGVGATAADRDRLVKLFKEAAEAAPPKGDKAEWKRRNERIVEAAEYLAAEDDPMKLRREQSRLYLAANCATCHLAHKPSPFEGGFGGGFPAFPGPQVGMPKLVFPKIEAPKFNFPNFPGGVERAAREPSAAEKGLGIATEAVGPALTAQLGLKAEQGRLVASVADDSAAANAGLEAYDVLLKIDGVAVSASTAVFVKSLAALKPGAAVELTVLRRAKERRLKLNVPAR